MMSNFVFDIEKALKVSQILDCQYQGIDGGYIWQLQSKSSQGQSLVLTVYYNAGISPVDKGTLVSVQTRHGYFELHNCNAFLTFEPDEIIFVQSTEEKLSCMILGKTGTCSLFSNIDKQILSTDLSSLDPAVLLAAMQLSIAEAVLAGDED